MTARAQKAAEMILDRVSIPTLPSTLAAVYRILDDPDSDAESIGDAIGRDPAIAAKVLRLSNSAYYSPAEPIRSLHRAVMTLGVNIIRRVVVQATVLNCYEHLVDNPYYDINDFWKHSIRSAIGSRIVARLAPQALELHPEEYYTAGLLQNVGVLILLDAVPEEYVQAQREADENKEPRTEAEKRVIGTDHATLGALFCEEWRLDENIMLSAKYHATTEPPGQGRHVWALSRMADYLAKELTPQADLEAVMGGIDNEMLVSLNLNRTDVQEACPNILEEFGDVSIEEFMGNE